MAKRGSARRTPTAQLALRGSWRARDRQDTEPRFETEGIKCPSWVSKDRRAKREWDGIIEMLQAAGVATVADAGMLGVYAQTMSEYVKHTEILRKEGEVVQTVNGNQVQHPAVALRNRAREYLLKLAAEFGLTAASRSRVSAVNNPGKAEPGSLEELLA